MLANLIMELRFNNVDIEYPPIETPLLTCLTRSFCSIMLKGWLNYSTNHLVIPSRRYVDAPIFKNFTSDRGTLQDRNYSINCDIFSNCIGGSLLGKNFKRSI